MVIRTNFQEDGIVVPYCVDQRMRYMRQLPRTLTAEYTQKSTIIVV
jgi:hypothetical protein